MFIYYYRLFPALSQTIALIKDIEKPKEKTPRCVFFKAQMLVSENSSLCLSDLQQSPCPSHPLGNIPVWSPLPSIVLLGK